MKATPRICAVFDMDDTLYLERNYVHSGFQAVGEWISRWLQIGGFAQCCWQRFEAGQRCSIFDSVLCDLGVAGNPELVSALVEIYRTHFPLISLAEDAFEALQAIRLSVPIAVISDGPVSSQSQKTAALGLSEFAAPVILTGLLGGGFRKPDPKAFQKLEQAQPAARYVYIADNPLKDFKAPRELGWRTVRVRRPGGLHYAVESSGVLPDYEMADCSVLPKLLQGL